MPMSRSGQRAVVLDVLDHIGAVELQIGGVGDQLTVGVTS
jgi:hypothetical protein